MIGTKSKASMAFLMVSLATSGLSCDRTQKASSSEDLVAEHIRARLISNSQALIPGSKHRMGALLEIEPGWHLYAPSQNDSGLPILLELSAPPGFEIAPLSWPTPHRLISEGPLLDHVYEGETIVLFELEVPPDARPGWTATIHCRTEWLVCGSGCIPGEGSFALTLPILEPGASATPSIDSARIHSAFERLPSSAQDATPALLQDWSNGTWSVRAPGAASLTFLPDQTCVSLDNLIAGGYATSDRLELRVSIEIPEDARVSGVLIVGDESGVTRPYRIDTPVPKTAA